MNDRDRHFDAAKASLDGNRRCNQDRCLVLQDANTVLLALADGLGGHPRGEVAAQLLIDVCETRFRNTNKPLFDPEQFMLECIGKAHQSILRFGRRQTPPIAPRTTAVLAIVQDGIAYWVHVGDSRLYLIRDGQVLAQTSDHATVRFVRQSGDAVSHPRASLTRCLGGVRQPPVTTCGSPSVLQAGDLLMLCSDGLWGQVSTQALIQAFDDRSSELQTRLDALLARATRTPNSDNVTAAVLHWLARSTIPADQAALREPGPDPHLDEAVRHLLRLIEKTDSTEL